MDCPKCGYAAPEGTRFCPNCGAALADQAPAGAAPDKAHIDVHQEVGRIDGGKATAVEVGEVHGPLTVQSTLNQVEATIINGGYVDQKNITQIVLVQPDALGHIAHMLAELQGVDKSVVRTLGAPGAPENVSRQIAELLAAHQNAAAQGVQLSPQAAYDLGLIATYHRDYEAALGYFQQATRGDPDFSDAYEVLASLQQSLAHDELAKNDLDAAAARLAQAREAAMRTDPLNLRALSIRGYIAKSLAQVAEDRHQPQERERYAREAARFFARVLELDPADAGAQNGLGNVERMAGNLDAAIAAHRRAIKLYPEYTAAWHDLAAAYEAKMQADPANAAGWRKRALRAWRKAYALAPDDPSFTADYVVIMGQRIRRLERAG